MGGDLGSPGDPSPGVTGETDGRPGLTGDSPLDGFCGLGEMKGGGGSLGRGGGGEADWDNGEAAPCKE